MALISANELPVPNNWHWRRWQKLPKILAPDFGALDAGEKTIAAKSKEVFSRILEEIVHGKGILIDTSWPGKKFPHCVHIICKGWVLLLLLMEVWVEILLNYGYHATFQDCFSSGCCDLLPCSHTLLDIVLIGDCPDHYINIAWSKSNFPSSPTRNITSHSKENLGFHTLLRWKMIIIQILAISLMHFLFKRLGEWTFWAQAALIIDISFQVFSENLSHRWEGEKSFDPFWGMEPPLRRVDKVWQRPSETA